MGRQAALKLGERADAHIILAARSLEPCEVAVQDIRAAGGSAEAMSFDGTDPASVSALIGAIEANHGRLDGAFNNLGDTLGDSLMHETPVATLARYAGR